MTRYLKSIKNITITMAIMVLANITIDAIGQDTLAGDYNLLVIKSGLHVIKETVTVKGKLEIQAGAKIEFMDPGILICEGELKMAGTQNDNIEIYGKPMSEGIGIVIRGVDNNASIVDIKYSIFKGLQLPLLFDFGWKRSSVSIANNYFIKNIGKTSVIQVLNPPFNLNIDSTKIDFKIEHNLFSDNNAAVYFEDLKSDHVQVLITGNTFYGNRIYGFKNYNISTNVLYGRSDEVYAKFNPFIENNSFSFNYLVDNITDTIVHISNFGVYGSSKVVGFKHNYLGSEIKSQIQKGIYDQAINYNVPKVDFEPFLNQPDALNPAHVYLIRKIDNSILADTLFIKEPWKGFILKSNSEVDFSKAVLKYSFFKDDSSFKKSDTVLKYDIQPNGLETKFTITSNLVGLIKAGFYTLSKLMDKNGAYVPDVKLGYIAYSNELRRRNLITEALKVQNVMDSVKKQIPQKDSIKTAFQKIETPFKKRFEIEVKTGGAIFLGTISNKSSIFGNDMNMLLGVNVNYSLFSNLSAGLSIESFKLSNSDNKSNNNEQIARGMSFSTSMLSISPSINYDFTDIYLFTKVKKIKPTVGVGLDIVSFNPTAMYNGTVYNLQPLGTGGQYADSTKKPYSTLTFGYFLNFKIKYQLNISNSVGVHMSYHVSMSNYLDDVGPDPYPSIASLLKSKIANKDAAIYFSNPTARNVLGQYRNSPDGAGDSYLNIGVFYSRKIFK